MPDSVEETRVSPTVLPTGTVTFLMTDIEGSTRLLQALGESYPELLADHHRLLREAFAPTGVEVSTEGDALFFVFHDAPSAIRAAIDGQRRLTAHAWPADAAVRVRMGIHSGEGRLLDLDYVGLDVHRVARITSAGHGGQIIVSDAARALAEVALPNDVRLRDLGDHRLKDLERSEHLFQVVAPGLLAEFPPLRSLVTRPHNLPGQVSSFVGREREKNELLELLRVTRLVTLTGPGGTGKTRLAIETAAAALDDCADGVFFVPLATIAEADLVAPAIATALNIRENPTSPILERLIEHLVGRALLLVLDNFEQVIDAAPTVGALLAAAPRVKVLVTSREPLRIAGEQQFPVPPLTLPDGKARPQELLAVDSVALFVQRARSVRPGFVLTPDNAAAVAGICTRLDGLPLALELAAARARLFEPSEIADRLDRRLSFLGGGRDLAPRQRTLRGAIDWSYELLSDPEQAIFRRLSIFAGGCTLDAVEAVCGPQELGLDAVDVMSSLHDKSLLRRVEAPGELRMTMLETIREYARERLEASGGEAAEIRARHADFFLSLAERVAQDLQGPEQQRWLDTLEEELDNFRAVIRGAIESAHPDTGLRLAAALTMFWLYRNHGKEGRRHLEELLALPASRATRAAGVDAAAQLAVWQSDYGATRHLAEEALAAYQELGDVAGVARQLSSLGYANIMGDPAAALEMFRQGIEGYRRAGVHQLIGGALVGMACAHMRLGNVGAATDTLEDAERAFREVEDDESLFIPNGLLGLAARLRGDLAEARRRYVELLVGSQEGGGHIRTTMALEFLADLALLQGDAERAAVLGAAEARLTDELGGTPSLELAGIPNVLERARAELGEERYEAATTRGRSAPLEEIVQLSLRDMGGAERKVEQALE